MERFVKVAALNDVDQDTHFQREGAKNTTLCGLPTNGTVVTSEMSCYRCHQFASGDL
jgi:hypothetical protein